jgi:hypothetical protein
MRRPRRNHTAAFKAKVALAPCARRRSSHQSTGNTIRDPGNSRMARNKARFATLRNGEIRSNWPGVRFKNLMEQLYCLPMTEALGHHDENGDHDG